MTVKFKVLVATLRSLAEFCEERSAFYEERSNFDDWVGGDAAGRASSYKIIGELIKTVLERYV